MPTADREDDLVDRLLAGHEEAWPRFVEVTHPLVMSIFRSRRYDRTDEDASREVAVRVLERVRTNDYAALRAYASARGRYGGSVFSRWLGVVIHHAYIDHVRARPEVHRARVNGARRLARTELTPLDELTASGTDGSHELQGVEILRIMRLLQTSEFPRTGRQALALWLAGYSANEIAERLSLPSAADAQRILHAARQRLRRLVHGPNEGDT